MSAANASAPSPNLQEEMRAHEPSMEEILASIRRIIADDQLAPLARRDREARRRQDVDVQGEEAATPAQKAYPAPALDAAPAPQPQEAAASDVTEAESTEAESDEPASPPAPVVEIRRLRLHRAAPPPADDVEEADAGDAPDEPLARAAEAEAPADDAADAEDEDLVSADTASSVASHFQALTASMLLNDSGLLQQYAQEMMRPMLRQWLDDNLPVIVERLVRAEIERVARGGRR